jgi:hypothetical protein
MTYSPAYTALPGGNVFAGFRFPPLRCCDVCTHFCGAAGANGRDTFDPAWLNLNADEMTISDLLKSLFAPVAASPASPPKLDAGSEPALSNSLGALSSRQQGWITIEEARQLFSPMDKQYAFGEMDDQGKANLASFAARHSSSFDIMPVEGRIYFARNAD